MLKIYEGILGLLFLKYKLDTPNNGEKAIMDENSVEFNIGFKYSNDEKNTLNGVEGNIKKADAHASVARAAVGNQPCSDASFTWFRNFMRASLQVLSGKIF